MSIPKVIVSLTSISQRIGLIEPVLRTLIDQNQPADEIRLYISEQPYLHDRGIPRHSIPEFIRHLDRTGNIALYYTPNTGPFRKLLPCLQECGNGSTLIVTADDDTLYPGDWLSDIRDLHVQFPGHVVAYGGRGIEFEDGKLLPYVNWQYGRCDNKLRNFAVGKYGVAYRGMLLDERVFDPCFLRLCPTNDDIWFKVMAILNGAGAAFVSSAVQRRFRNSFPTPECLYDMNQDSNLAQMREVLRYARLSESELEEIIARERRTLSKMCTC